MSKSGKKKQKERLFKDLFGNLAKMPIEMRKVNSDTVNPLRKPESPFENPAHELFCTLYAGAGTRHFFNNAQNCYLEAMGYGPEIHQLESLLVLESNPKKRKVMSQRKKSLELVARVEGSRLLTNPNIKKRIAHLLDQFIDHEVMDRELAKTAMQDFDLHAKVDAIKEYNRVRDRVKDNKLTGDLKISWLSPAEKKK